jgi:DNA-binding Xre family transcriptional regulator
MNDHQFNYITKLKKEKKKKKVNPKTLEHLKPYTLEFKTLKKICSELHKEDPTVKGFLI